MISQERFNELMKNYLQDLAQQEPSPWSEDARWWCEQLNLIQGDENGNKMYRKFLTREEMASILFKLHKMNLI